MPPRCHRRLGHPRDKVAVVCKLSATEVLAVEGARVVVDVEKTLQHHF